MKNKLFVGIDTIQIQILNNDISYLISKLDNQIQKLNIQLIRQYYNNEHNLIMDNGSSICKIKLNQIGIIIEIFSLFQIENYYKISDEHQFIVDFILNNYQVVIKKIDISVDHFFNYDKTIIKYKNRYYSSTYDILYLTKFKTKSIHIPNDNPINIELKKRFKNVDETESKIKENYYHQKELVNSDGVFTDYIRYKIKDAKSYFYIKNMIDEHIKNTNKKIDIKYNPYDLNENDVYIDYGAKSDKIISYNKFERDSLNQNRSNLQIPFYKQIAAELNQSINKTKHSRLELSLRLNLNINDNDLMKKIENKVSKYLNQMQIIICNTINEKREIERKIKQNHNIKKELKNYDTITFYLNNYVNEALQKIKYILNR